MAKITSFPIVLRPALGSNEMVTFFAAAAKTARNLRFLQLLQSSVIRRSLNIEPNNSQTQLLPDQSSQPMAPRTLGRPAEILLVEDNLGDVELTREGLDAARVSNNLYVVSDGIEALAFLRREGKYAGVPQPDLILLDLNLPKKDGREVLAEIKTDENLRVIPLVVLTTSKANEDILGSYKLNANSYIAKPVDFSGFTEIVQAINHFWFTVVVLPPKV